MPGQLAGAAAVVCGGGLLLLLLLLLGLLLLLWLPFLQFPAFPFFVSRAYQEKHPKSTEVTRWGPSPIFKCTLPGEGKFIVVAVAVVGDAVVSMTHACFLFGGGGAQRSFFFPLGGFCKNFLAGGAAREGHASPSTFFILA